MQDQLFSHQLLFRGGMENATSLSAFHIDKIEVNNVLSMRVGFTCVSVVRIGDEKG